MTRPRSAAVLVVVTAILSIAAAPRQGFDATKVPGGWRPFPMNSLQRPYEAPAWLTLAVVKDLGAHLNEVAEVLHRTAFLASPSGWVMFPHAQVDLNRSWTHAARSDARWLVIGRLSLRASTIEGDGHTVYDAGSAFVLNFVANDLTCALNNDSAWATDAEGPMFLEVEAPDERVHGYPRYDHCVLITHRSAPMFVPVPVERVIKARIAEIDKRLAPIRELLAATKGRTDVNASANQTLIDTVKAYDQVLVDLRAKLAALTPEQRRARARASSQVFTDDPLDVETGRLIVEANPAFFDPTRPSDIQVLSVFLDCVHDGCVNHDVVDKLTAQLDWNALAAIVR